MVLCALMISTVLDEEGEKNDRRLYVFFSQKKENTRKKLREKDKQTIIFVRLFFHCPNGKHNPIKVESGI